MSPLFRSTSAGTSVRPTRLTAALEDALAEAGDTGEDGTWHRRKRFAVDGAQRQRDDEATVMPLSSH